MNSGLLEDYVSNLIASNRRNIAIDLSPLDYVYSDAMNAFIRLARLAIKSGGRVTLVAPQEKVRDIIHSAGIFGMMKVFDEFSALTSADATASFSSFNAKALEKKKPKKPPKLKPGKIAKSNIAQENQIHWAIVVLVVVAAVIIGSVSSIFLLRRNVNVADSILEPTGFIFDGAISFVENILPSDRSVEPQTEHTRDAAKILANVFDDEGEEQSQGATANENIADAENENAKERALLDKEFDPYDYERENADSISAPKKLSVFEQITGTVKKWLRLN